ncbi:hypothetical protein FOA52_000587 [Chlamydomonas sp. UWO 241]|nr:hypothetical protein FOA52_000587 [Chlamydomonas sp. UWO 241]
MQSVICRFFAAGHCARGETCHFLHGQEEAGPESSGVATWAHEEEGSAWQRIDSGHARGPVVGSEAWQQQQQQQEQQQQQQVPAAAAAAAARTPGAVVLPDELDEHLGGFSPVGGSIGDHHGAGWADGQRARGAGAGMAGDCGWEDWVTGGSGEEGYQDEAGAWHGGEGDGNGEHGHHGGHYDEAGQCLEVDGGGGGGDAWGGGGGGGLHSGGNRPHSSISGDGEAGARGSAAGAHLPLCSEYAARGTCARGLGCYHVHGDECGTCGRHALHPYSVDERDAHAEECARRHERLAARLRSAAVECGICLEKVLSQPTPSDRRFGLLTCNHPFCLKCIRGWRSKGTADLDTAVRTCPLCRATTHFVVPSTVWPDGEADKAGIVSGYKAKLGSIDCRLFVRGEGSCPFGTSCFYRHAFPDGTEEPKDPMLLRRYMTGDGDVRMVSGVRLSDFLSTSTGRIQAAGRQNRVQE